MVYAGAYGPIIVKYSFSQIYQCVILLFTKLFLTLIITGFLDCENWYEKSNICAVYVCLCLMYVTESMHNLMFGGLLFRWLPRL